MGIYNSRQLLNNLNNISSKLLMPLIASLFVLHNTAVNLWIGEKFETIQNIIAIIILGIVACNILYNPKENIPIWIKENILVILYFVVRFISLWNNGFEYSVIRSIFFEAFFIVGITKVTIGEDRTSSFYLKLFIILEFICTFVSLVVFYGRPFFDENIQELLKSTMYWVSWQGDVLFISNQNTAGIMAGFAIVIAIMCYGKNIINNKLLIIYGLYNVFALILFGCRSSDVGIAVVICAILFRKAFPRIKVKFIAIIILVLVTISLVPLYGFMIHQGNEDYTAFTEIEYNVDSVSTGRYIIWKGCYLSQRDDYLFGKGSFKLEQEDRKRLVEGLDPNYYWRQVQAVNLGPHNGYIGMISGTGIIGLLLFIGILLQRMKKSKSLDKGNWYLMLIFIFVVNCFESLFVLNRFFTCFYMFLLLAIDFNDDGEKIKKLSSQEETN